jgi:hypothetical protein
MRAPIHSTTSGRGKKPQSSCGMSAAGATGRTAGQGLIHDLANATRATAALCAAAKTTIDFTRGARRSAVHGATHIMVAQDIAGTNNHREFGSRISDADRMSEPSMEIIEQSQNDRHSQKQTKQLIP